MASKKISQLNTYTTPIGTDLLAIVDVTTNETKKIELNDVALFVSPYQNSGWVKITNVATMGGTPVALPDSYPNVQAIILTGKRNTTGWTTTSATKIRVKVSGIGGAQTLFDFDINILQTNASAYGYITEQKIVTTFLGNPEKNTNVIFTTDDGSNLTGGDYELYAMILYAPINMP